MSFRAQIRRAKPGSLVDGGGVVDYTGTVSDRGPCFVPDTLSAKRKGALGRAGWCRTPARDWPSVLPAQGLFCIVRTQAATPKEAE